MKKYLLLLLLPALLLTAPVAKGAQDNVCLNRSHMIDTLIDQYGEQLAEVREVRGEGLLEFHVSPEDGTWTAVLTDDDGLSCVIAVGEGLDPSKFVAGAVNLEI